MRSYENSGYNPYNDNYRSETRSSGRSYSSGDFDSSPRNRSYGNSNYRTGDLGSGRDAYSNSGYGNTSNYGRSAGSSQYGSGSSYGSGYGSSSGGYGGSSGYGSSRYSGGDYDRDRSSDRNTWDQTKETVSNAWNSITGDDDNDHNDYRNRNYGSSGYGSGSSDYRSGYGSSSGGYGSSGYGNSGYNSNFDRSGSNYGSGSRYGSSSNYGSSGYGSGSNFGSSSNYGDSGSRYGSGYGSFSSSDRDRYSSDYDRDSRDRGFFDRAGDEVKSWFGDDEAERRRRMDEMQNREHNNDYNRSGRGSSSYERTYSGPPYSYGSSSRRDYEW